MLKGCPCDPNNPVKLNLCMFLDIYIQSKKAKEDFWKLYPSLFPCEKEKFDELFAQNPWTKKYSLEDDQFIEDKFQSAMNKIPVYSVTLNTFPKKVIPAPLTPFKGCP